MAYGSFPCQQHRDPVDNNFLTFCSNFTIFCLFSFLFMTLEFVSLGQSSLKNFYFENPRRVNTLISLWHVMFREQSDGLFPSLPPINIILIILLFRLFLLAL